MKLSLRHMTVTAATASRYAFALSEPDFAWRTRAALRAN
jgi:hypothetical protein